MLKLKILKKYMLIFLIVLQQQVPKKLRQGQQNTKK